MQETTGDPFDVKEGFHEPVAGAFAFLSAELRMRLFYLEVCQAMTIVAHEPRSTMR